MKFTLASAAMRFGSSCFVLAAAMTLPGQAFAQDAADDEPAADSAIVVTAQRREERLVDVPIAVTSVSGDTLQDSGVDSVLNLPQAVSGLRLDYSGPYVQPTVRGVGSPLVGPGLNSNVSTYVDGFYVPNPLGTDFQLLSVENVQVLKGPQGTLFGRNATGGAILVTTADPSFSPTGEFRVTYSRFNKANVSGYASTGLSDTIAVDLAAFYERGDGYIRNIVSDEIVSKYNKWTVRPKVLFEPSDSVSFVLSYQHSEVDDPSPFLTSSYEGLTSATVIAPTVLVATGSRETSNGDPAVSTLNNDMFTLTGEFDLGFAN